MNRKTIAHALDAIPVKNSPMTASATTVKLAMRLTEMVTDAVGIGVSVANPALAQNVVMNTGATSAIDTLSQRMMMAKLNVIEVAAPTAIKEAMTVKDAVSVTATAAIPKGARTHLNL